MSSRIAAAASLCSLFGFSNTAGAHRLDEYLQATRISIGANRIVLQMDLTPGMEVAAHPACGIRRFI
jgi:hypothetical protein